MVTEQPEQQQQQQLALLPPDLQQVQELLCDFTQQNAALEIQLRQRRSPRGLSQSVQPPEDVQLLRHQQHQRAQAVNQQQAGQQLSLLLPLSSLFHITAKLFASLKADDPQQLKLAADIGGLWCVLGYGIPPGAPQRSVSAATTTAAAAAGGQLLAFFSPLRSAIQEALGEALRSVNANPGIASAALIEALGHIGSQQLRETVRAWQQRFLPK